MTTKRLWKRQNRACVLAFVSVGLAAMSGASAGAEGIHAPWVEGYQNKARVLAGRVEPTPDGKIYLGVEIQMPPGWKTYWRMPGDAGGVPPEFDWSQSDNLKSANVLYPAPRRLTDKSGSVIGYQDGVVFPIELTAKDATKPVDIKLTTTYGVCKELCIPAEATLQIMVPPNANKSPTLADAVTKVPSQQPDASKDPILKTWRIENEGALSYLHFDVSDPGSSVEAGDAFVEAPEGAYLPLPKPISSANGVTSYKLDLADAGGIAALKGKALTLTLVGAKGQSETTIQLK